MSLFDFFMNEAKDLRCPYCGTDYADFDKSLVYSEDNKDENGEYKSYYFPCSACGMRIVLGVK